MIGSNEKTLATYNSHASEYVAGTTHVVFGAIRDWINEALAGLPLDAALLEIGSAIGRDAAYIHEQGYEVECTDASTAFVQHLRRLGFEAKLFNVLNDAFTAKYDLIIANAVLLHFDRQEFAEALRKSSRALKPNGRFAFSLKRGDGEEWSDEKLNAPRFFCYWQPEDLAPLLSRARFSSWAINEVATERAHAEWLYIVARA
ncbi:class I SAM-dependent methyltransferase [Parasphingopyxis marina]|nr:class I SAM-dependent methyltransferase [Parasphingopyxis marina]